MTESPLEINPDCQGTHYLQSEISELESRASAASLWEERYNMAAQANARLEKEKDIMRDVFKKIKEHIENHDALPDCSCHYVIGDYCDEGLGLS
jgi:hypothetical protein